jgi:hypothetical protein
MSAVVTAVALLCALFYGGLRGVLFAAVLGVLEISLSFDNAVINAAVLERMSVFWQRMFLTVGMVVAVFGMRLLFPLAVVAIGTHINPVQALDLALHRPPSDYFPDGRPRSYQALLADANPKIAAFGGAFLLMLFLDFVFAKHSVTWLSWIERPLATLGRFRKLSVIVALTIVLATGGYITPDRRTDVVIASGILGIVSYLAVDGVSSLFGTGARGDTQRQRPATPVAGAAGLALFAYLELLDASFSFDGVIGAFAVTSDPIIIALGLGLIGAMFVRSLTVYLVRRGALAQYIYLRHGAHWAIGALAVILLISTGYHVNETITGLIGLVVIAAAFGSSVAHNRRAARPG